MIGIPFKLSSQDEATGAVEKTIYLRTRRSGQAGESFKAAKRAYHAAEWRMVRSAKRLAALDARINAVVEREDADFDTLSADREELLAVMGELVNELADRAEHIVRLALAENYNRTEVDQILDNLTDTDLQTLVAVVETGEPPADFIAGGARPPSAISTAPSGGLPPPASAPQAGPLQTSSAES